MEDNVKIEIQEKSVFERGIIEAFKQNKVSDVYEKLGIAYSELPLYINEIKKQNTQEKNKHFILNSNIIDKLGRILERNYININILISKIFNILLNEENIPLLSDNPIILINLSNQLMTVLDIIKSCENFDELTKKSINYMKYLTENSDKYLSEEQTDIINNLQKVLNEKIVSPAYVNFKNNFEKDILIYCKGESIEEKGKGLENLNSYFYKLNSLNEQFELLCLYGQDIIKAIISKPNPSLIDIYFKLSYFFLSFLYNFIYKIKLSPNENSANINDYNENIKKINEQYYILDSMEENIELSENLYVTKFHGKEYHNMKFLEKTLYELEGSKNILLKHTSIFTLSVSILNCLILFEDSFKSQFASFLMLKRLYFIFPKYRKEIEDLIITSLVNLMSLDDVVVNESKEPYESFLYYLLQNGDEDMKSKLKEKLTKKQNIIKKDYINNINTNEVEKIFVESDIVYLSDFNLNIGCPINIEIAAGDEEQKLIEIKYSNSVLYIGFNLPYYDINFHLIKYCPNVNNDLMSNKEKGEEIVQYEEHKFFYEIFKLEKTQGAKIIIFIKNPGIYKVLFDNKYSWFKAKLLRYRCTILKEMNTLNLNSNFSDEIINNEKKDESDENKNENNEKNEDKKEGEDEENKKSVKIAVKFGNTTNIPNIDLGEAEEDINDNDIDVELK
jgi:hypothetical protein